MDFDIKKYAHLARIKLSKKEEEVFQKDIEEILEHVAELEKVNVKNVLPMTGGTALKNIFREDKPSLQEDFEPAFPNQEKGHLKVPKVFDND
ncbi:Asp-tRNA(Asn)/Glu-tRNA(Gln) amidotransferase subunit GatC [Patescibacteria group bacterium]|nr:Asp-tRNA(Asn)/Glu-tRNA(Gln) amidotransferase subunit GatC [Patescibacteria group bacterium]